jgi:ketosteroid isomerase-like protein
MAQGETENRNRHAVQAQFDRWRSGTGSIYESLESDVKWTIAGNSAVSKTYESGKDFIDHVIHPFNERLSSRLVPTVRGVYADGDWVTVLWDGNATARDGLPYVNTYSWYLQMREGRIINAIAFFDSIAFNDLWTRVKPAQ